MSAAFWLFASTFFLVFALGLQSLNVNRGYRWWAFFNSYVISASNLVLLKLAPEAGWLEILGYMNGGPLGIVASMWVHEKLTAGGGWRARFAERRLARADVQLQRQRARAVPKAPPQPVKCGRCGLGFSIACWRVDCPRHDDVH